MFLITYPPCSSSLTLHVRRHYRCRHRDVPLFVFGHTPADVSVQTVDDLEDAENLSGDAPGKVSPNKLDIHVPDCTNSNQV